MGVSRATAIELRTEPSDEAEPQERIPSEPDQLSTLSMVKRAYVCGLGMLAAAIGGGGVGAMAREQRTAGRMVVVPRVLNEAVEVAYRRLHQAGLRVSIPAGIQFTIFWSQVALQVTPAAGQDVARDSVVTVRLGYPCCAPSIAAPVKQPSYRVPNFRGLLASAAEAWVENKTLAFDGRLGRLRGGTAAALFENYRVTRQQPAAGTKLRFTGRPGAGGVREITPLSIWGTQAVVR